MNYLAHTWLARQSDEALLGGLLGDFVHGNVVLLDWPPEVRSEILLHRRIDRFTDTYPAVTAARAGFGDLRRYAGIVLDVYFDHLLARDWLRWNDTPLSEFTARVYRVLDEYRELLPPRLKRITPHMAAEDWLGSYRERDSVDSAIRGISMRLSRNGDKLRACLPVLRTHEAEVDAAFEVFFPELIEATAAMRAVIRDEADSGH
ncbi:MAG: DUF479 domain-containing protein [Xanthomonadaceae bacterium]|nr:DUF479 domain-containing protein [Xanthomonadaceae bacterium]